MGAPTSLAEGQTLDGKYVLHRVLGEGGMGIVWAARHRVLGTELAIKVLLPDARDPQTVARFHREARASVRITSIHAARVHDVAELDDGTPYMVMELLRGQDLGQMLASSGPLPPHLAIDYVSQALVALEEAHAIGLVHRDLKPSNLYLATQPNGTSILKVLDFGIARDFHDHDDARLTSTRAVMGSPSYMSPEQLRAARVADARSDVWSLGVCLYELVTGQLPFEAASLPDLMVAVLQSQPTPPEVLAPGIPAGLVEVIRRCIEKDPARRFQSAAELRAALIAAKSTGAASSPRMSLHLGSASHSSLPAVATTDPSLLAPTRSPGTASRRGMVAFAAAFVVVSFAAVVAFMVLRPKAAAHAASTSIPASATTADTFASPLPPDLAPAGGVNAPPPATGAPAPPASASTAPAPAKSAVRTPASKGDGKRPVTGSSATPATSGPPPTSSAPRPPPDFDPGKSF